MCDRCQRSAGRFFLRLQGRRAPHQQWRPVDGEAARSWVLEQCVCEDCFDRIHRYWAYDPVLEFAAAYNEEINSP